MSRTSKAVVAGLLLGALGLAGTARASQVLTEPVEFKLNISPTSDLSDIVFHYSTGTNPGGSTVQQVGRAPANQISLISARAEIAGGIPSLLPTWTSFSLYTVQVAGYAPTYGICVAIRQSDYPSAAGQSFDQLFGQNIDAAFNDGQTHTEQDLINEFLSTGQADQYFTAGIANTPAADIPYGQTGVLVMYSNGTNGGTMSVTAVPEPASVGLLSAGVLGLALRRRR